MTRAERLTLLERVTVEVEAVRALRDSIGACARSWVAGYLMGLESGLRRVAVACGYPRPPIDARKLADKLPAEARPHVIRELREALAELEHGAANASAVEESLAYGRARGAARGLELLLPRGESDLVEG